MKRLSLISAIGLTACSSAAEHQHNQLMQQVEERVQLPKGAERLDRYARYYAKDGDQIVAVYTTLVDPKGRYLDLPVGHQRWLGDHRNLPAISDGGCSIVNVIYNPNAQTEPKAFCNGAA